MSVQIPYRLFDLIWDFEDEEKAEKIVKAIEKSELEDAYYCFCGERIHAGNQCHQDLREYELRTRPLQHFYKIQILLRTT